MSRFNKNDDFDKSEKFVVSKPFKFAGKAYAGGEVFEWRKTACTERKLRTMYSSRMITTKREFDLRQKKAEAATVEETAKPKRATRRRK